MGVQEIMDAWQTLIINATDLTDAWSALNSQKSGSAGVGPGMPVDELKFILNPILEITGSVVVPELSGAVNPITLVSDIATTQVAGSIQIHALGGSVIVGEL